jgi:hypothetical protein
MNLTWLIGRPVECCNSDKSGYVLAACVLQDRVEFLLCADEHEKEFKIDVKDILSWGERIVYEDRARIEKEAKPVELGKQCFDITGNFLGILKDYTIDDGKLQTAHIGNLSLSPEALTVGDVVLISDRGVTPDEKPQKRRGRRKKQAQSFSEVPAPDLPKIVQEALDNA